MPKPLRTDTCITEGCDGHVEGGSVEVEKHTAYQTCGCDKCGSEWELGFNLYDKTLLVGEDSDD